MISRRGLLKVLVPAAVVVGARIAGVERVLPQGQAAGGRVVASRWSDRGASAKLALQSAEGQRTVTSVVFRAPHQFNGIGSYWAGDVRDLQIRTSPDGSDWSQWQTVTSGEVVAGKRDPMNRKFGDLLTLASAHYVQYRYSIPAGQAPADVTLILMDGTNGPQVVGPLELDRGRYSIAGATPQPVISRAMWGCDESLRYTNGQEVWPPEYRTVQKAIVHHTATSNDYTDAAREVRLIYYYHSVQVDDTGWGDIGYNYLIDKWGNIYEGRAGGDRVVGGHALRYNYGSVGIGCLGTYSGSSYPSSAMKTALARLIAWKCRYLDPHGQAHFVDRQLANILGHRDVDSTTCPGTNLYANLPGIRGDVLWNLDSQVPTPMGQIRRVAFIPNPVTQGNEMRVEITVENTGTGTMVSQGPPSNYIYSELQTFLPGYPEIAGAWRVAVDFAGNPTGKDHPYRWGLPDALEPGQSATVIGRIQMNSLQVRDYWAGLVKEGHAWVHDGAGMASITVSALATQTPTPTATPTATPTCVPRPTPPPTVVVTPNPNLPRKYYVPQVSKPDPGYYCD